MYAVSLAIIGFYTGLGPPAVNPGLNTTVVMFIGRVERINCNIVKLLINIITEYLCMSILNLTPHRLILNFSRHDWLYFNLFLITPFTPQNQNRICYRISRILRKFLSNLSELAIYNENSEWKINFNNIFACLFVLYSKLITGGMCTNKSICVIL